MRCVALLAMIMGVLFPLVTSAPSHAQATRTWVSGVGDDANPCSRTAPCKTFAGSISKTAAGGEINVLDPGGFGAITITKSITIRADHVEAGVLVAGTNGIVVAAGPTDKVTIEGLDIEGLGTGLNGVNFISGLKVNVIRCRIHNFTQNGVNVASTTSSARAFVNDSYIYQNAGGVNVSGTSNTASVINTQIISNTTFAVQADGAGNVLILMNSTLEDTGTSISLLNSGQAKSIGPSNLVENAGAFSVTFPFK